MDHVHPLGGACLVIAVHRASSLPSEPDGAEPLAHVALHPAAHDGKAPSSFKPLSTSALKSAAPQWGRVQPVLCADGRVATHRTEGCGPYELLVLREDELIMSGMSLAFNVIAARSGGGNFFSSGATEVAVAAAEVHLASPPQQQQQEQQGAQQDEDEEQPCGLLRNLRAGRTAVLYLPLNHPAGSKAAAAAAAAAARAAPKGSAPAGNTLASATSPPTPRAKDASSRSAAAVAGPPVVGAGAEGANVVVGGVSSPLPGGITAAFTVSRPSSQQLQQQQQQQQQQPAPLSPASPMSHQISVGEEGWMDVGDRLLGAAGSGATSVSAQSMGPAGMLVVSCWLQRTWADDHQLGAKELPPDLQPTWSLPVGHMPPGSVMHSPVAVAYAEPCVVMLRIRLLGVWGLVPRGASGAAGGANRGAGGPLAGLGGGLGGVQGSTAHLGGRLSSMQSMASLRPQASSSNLGSEQDGPVTRTAKELGLRIQVHGDALLHHASNLWNKFRPGGGAPSGPRQQQQQQQQQQEGGGSAQRRRPSATPEALPSPRRLASDASSTPLTFLSRSPSSSVAHQPSGGSGDEAGWDVVGAGGAAAAARPAAPPAARVTDLRHVVLSNSGAATPQHVSSVMDALEGAGFSAATPDPPSLDASYIWVKVTCAGQEHTSRMAPLAPSCAIATMQLAGGVSGRAKRSGAAAVPEAGASGDQEARPRVLAPGAPGSAAAAANLLFGPDAMMSAGWGADEPPVLVAVPRPLTAPGGAWRGGPAAGPAGGAGAQGANVPVLELDISATKDAKSRGRSLAKVTTSVARLLQAVGAAGGDSSASALELRPGDPPGTRLLQRLGLGEVGGVSPEEDPCAWPQGEALLQGKLEGGSPVAVAVAVEVVDADARARSLSVPLVEGQQQQQQQPKQVAPAASSQSLAPLQPAEPSQPSTPHAGPGRAGDQGPAAPPALAPPPLRQASGRQASRPAGAPPSTSLAWCSEPLVLHDCMRAPDARSAPTRAHDLAEAQQQGAAEGAPGSGAGSGGAPSAGGRARRREARPPDAVLVGWLDLALHSVRLVGTSPSSSSAAAASAATSAAAAATAQGAQGGPAGDASSQHQARALQHDCYIVIKCGPSWVATRPRAVLAGSAPGSACMELSVAMRLPLLHPSQMLTLALFRQEGLASSAARKVASATRTLGIHISTGDQLLARLKLRASQLRAGLLHAAAALPMLGDRQHARGPSVVAYCHASLMVTYPSLSSVLGAYLSPPLTGALTLLQMGCVAGDDVRSPYLGRADLAVSEETVERRRRRAALGWLSTGVSPPLSHRVARRLLEDGRGDFALSRTLVNWRRLTNAIGSVQPLVRWWKGVQSWQRPWHSARVAVVIVLAANWPSRALALGCLALVTWMVRRKVRLGDLFGAPPPMLEDSALENEATALMAAAAAAAAAANEEQAAGDAPFPGERAGGRRAPFTLQPASSTYFDSAAPGGGAEGPTGGILGDAPGLLSLGGEGLPAASERDGVRSPTPGAVHQLQHRAGGLSAYGSRASTPQMLHTMQSSGGGLPPLGSGGGAPPGGLQHSASTVPVTSLAPSALDAGFWGASAAGPGGQPPAGVGLPPHPPLAPAANDSVSVASSRAHSPVRSRLAATSTAAAAAAGAPGAAGGREVPTVPAASSTSVPLDPLGALRAQYDGMVRFMLTVQNTLDGLAAGVERFQALLSWSDPMATGMSVLGLLLLSALLWLFGLPALLAALLLFDMRPPVLRDPWPAPPLNLLGYLPTRSDQLG